MKNTTLNIALFFIVIASASCNKISENIQQDIVINDTVYFDIPVLNSITAPTSVSGIPLTINLEEQLKSGPNSFTIDQIKSTKIKSLVLGLELIGDTIDPDNNFGNLETIRFRIAANGTFGNIANTTIPSSAKNGAIALSPVIIPDSLKTFLLNPTRTYDVTVKAKKITTTPMGVRAAATYTITVAK